MCLLRSLGFPQQARSHLHGRGGRVSDDPRTAVYMASGARRSRQADSTRYFFVEWEPRPPFLRPAFPVLNNRVGPPDVPKWPPLGSASACTAADRGTSTQDLAVGAEHGFRGLSRRRRFRSCARPRRLGEGVRCLVRILFPPASLARRHTIQASFSR